MSRPRPGEDLGQISGYRLTGFLGEGGQGVVYRGLSPSGDQVAIKVLHARMSEDAEERRRFFRQVELARRVAPFCTARVLDMGMHDDRPYIVSEYVRGASLDRVVRQDGPRTGGGLERLAVATATALAAIHRAGVVHRDFKPGNVILGPEGPVVIDFGISRALDHAATQSGAFGTPGYMAPEQVSAERIGPAADVFSWAATMVFAATGRRPFAGASVAAVLHALLYDEPDLTGVPDSLRPLVVACLGKDPGRRPAAEDLVRALTGDDTAPVAQAPEPTAPAPGPASPPGPVPTPAPGPTPAPASAPSSAAVSAPLSARPPSWRVPRRALLAVAVAVAAVVVAVSMWPEPRQPDPLRTTDPVRTTAPVIPFGGGIGEPLAGHTNDVRAVAVGTRDGVPIMLTGSDDETARVWNLRTSQQLGRPLAGHTEWIRSAALDQLDGAPIAVTASDDDTARVWDLTTGRARTLKGHTGDVKSVATGRIGGTHVAVTASADGTARVWDLRTGKQLGAPLAGHTGGVWAVAVGQVGGAPIAVTTGDDKTVRVWDLNSRKQLGAPMTGHAGWVRSVALGNLDGTPVALTGSEDMTVRVWDLTTRKQLGEPLTGHTGWIWSVAISNLDGTPVAVTGSEDATVRVWDLNSRKQLGTPFTGHADCVWSVAIGLLDGRPIAVSGSRDQTARAWSLGPPYPAGS
ncbi:WD40 repeat domain-containing serine/threonine protein kinase [Nonomuraea basaltis]|uniref:WD40 repeat domain-containing serine/threonine protein kinase n=1 Tax=Nonomuraea basaltis TaxID=2495887 RepID=UPI001486DE8E|nr:serine/threonine-protein kinase [Nonomuraea basaltis]